MTQIFSEPVSSTSPHTRASDTDSDTYTYTYTLRQFLQACWSERLLKGAIEECRAGPCRAGRFILVLMGRADDGAARNYDIDVHGIDVAGRLLLCGALRRSGGDPQRPELDPASVLANLSRHLQPSDTMLDACLAALAALSAAAICPPSFSRRPQTHWAIPPVNDGGAGTRQPAHCPAAGDKRSAERLAFAFGIACNNASNSDYNSGGLPRTHALRRHTL